MSKPRALRPEEARHSLVHRFAGRADRLRQIGVRLGTRPYLVDLVWVVWEGSRGQRSPERGTGREREIARLELLPTPKVASLDTVAFQPLSGGILPVGSVRVTQISALYTQDQLTGLAVPTREFVARNDPPRATSAEDLPARPSVKSLPEPYDFFWEVREDGRGDDPSTRSKFHLAAWPWRNATGLGWEVVLERQSNDEERDGSLNSGFDAP